MFPQIPQQLYHYWPSTYLKVGCIAFVIAAIGMPVMIFALRRLGIVDQVDAAKLHDRPVPRGGGVMIFVAFVAAVVFPHYYDYPMKGLLIGSFLCMLVGAIDDFRGGVPAYVKLLTLFVVTLILSFYNVRVKLFGVPGLDTLVTMLWIAGVVSAFNGLDNMDGLASGTAVIVAGVFLTIAMQAFWAAGTETSLSWFGLLAAALIGANLGFLLFNWKPAKIFMGDSGSFFLGFTLAALGVMGEWTPHRLSSCTIPVLILGAPLFDFAYIILARILRGETRTLRQVIEHCGLDHLSHRLVWIGFSQRQAVLFIYLISVALGLAGILLRNGRGEFDSLCGLLQGLAIFAIIMILMRAAERRHAADTSSTAANDDRPPQG